MVGVHCRTQEKVKCSIAHPNRASELDAGKGAASFNSNVMCNHISHG